MSKQGFSMKLEKKFEWWKTAIIYHIYIMSFSDSNADGIGDIPGIINHLDYLKWLGIDTIWVSPFYPTPFKDNGYDIKDYFGVDEKFGTLDDFNELLKQCHLKELKLILDFVPNHTSEEHPWFIESRSNQTNSKRDWFIWQDPNPSGGPPNNWISISGGSSWEFDSQTNQYYYHSFLKYQPDLNWRNTEVQDAMFDIMRYWLDKGVDGFRIDLMGFLIEDKFFRNNPPNAKQGKDSALNSMLSNAFSCHQREINEIIAKMRHFVDGYGEKLLLGEVYLSIDELMFYHANANESVHLPGNFLLILEDWNASILFDEICNYEASLNGDSWPNWVLSNHDNPRIASKIGREQARVAALFMLTSRGTPIIYYGDEIGMQDTAIPKNKMKDPAEKKRDPHRSPMQWSSGPNAGFTSGTPWQMICSDYGKFNVESEKDDPTSLLNFYRDLLHIRKNEPVLNHGIFIPVGIEDSVFSFIRKDMDTGEAFLIICNLGHKSIFFTIPPYFELKAVIVFGTDISRKGEQIGKEIRVNGDEAILAKII